MFFLLIPIFIFLLISAKKKAPKAPQPPPRNGLPPVAPPRTVTPVKFNDDEVHEISLVENDENKREQIVSPSPVKYI